jgi:prepilin peptidase CpaA
MFALLDAIRTSPSLHPSSLLPTMHTPELLCTATLGTLLLTACVSDVRVRRIPNWLTGGGMLCGLGVQAAAPAGAGLFDVWWGGTGIGTALLGLLTGLALFLPLHLLRAVGAGDVKLLAMVGVWLGPELLLGATLLTLLAGGVMAVAMMLACGSARRVLGNVRLLLTTAIVGAHTGRPTPLDPSMTSGVRLPYAVPIAAGTFAQLALLLSTHWR